ncbi:hypothetical protein UXN93_11295 [Enterobacter hormaechei]|nr:hypothetical protein [Enterobacter hormaechei subsp. steigerwaltii]
MGLAGGLNLYAYAPNPLSYIDALGLTNCNNPPDTEPQHDDGWRCHAWLKDSRDNPLEHDYNRNGQMVERRRRKPESWREETLTEYLEWDVKGQLVRLRSDTQETRCGYDGLGRRVFKKTVKAGEDTAALRWFWWEGDALMPEAQETADTTETCTAACDIQLPGSDQARKATLTQLAQGLTLRVLWGTRSGYIH